LFKGKAENINFWRDKAGNEVDLIYEADGLICPVEIKFSASPKKDLFRGFEKAAEKSNLKIGRKKIICTSNMNVPVDEKTDIVSALSIL
jgi:predicted AAA+ superfamily ATPase